MGGLDVWVLDALRYSPHPSHFSVADALGWIGRLKPRRAILTNLHADLDYETLRRAAAHPRSQISATAFVLRGLFAAVQARPSVSIKF